MKTLIIIGAICFIIRYFTGMALKGSLTYLEKMQYKITGKLSDDNTKLSYVVLIAHLGLWACIILFIVNVLIKLFA